MGKTNNQKYFILGVVGHAIEGIKICAVCKNADSCLPPYRLISAERMYICIMLTARAFSPHWEL